MKVDKSLVVSIFVAVLFLVFIFSPITNKNGNLPIIASLTVTGIPQCGVGHTANSDGTCTAIIYADGNDVALGYWSSPSSWENIKSAPSAEVYQLSTTEGILRGPQNIRSATGANSLIRTALPFDTRTIPSGATISSANLMMTPTASFSVYATTNDYVSVVGLTLNNPPAISLNDYGRFESLEISNRFDISSQARANTPFIFVLNNFNYLKPGDWSVLGLRGGHDLIGQIGPGTQAAYVTFYSANSGSNKPRLDVRYIPTGTGGPICTPTGIEVCDQIDNDCNGQIDEGGVCAPPPPPPIQTCPNNVREGAETCDGADLSGQTCNSLNPTFNAGTLACNNTCTGFITTGCATNACLNNSTPAAVLNISKTTALVNESLTFDASGSTDNGQLTYNLSYGDDTSNVTTITSTHAYSTAGTYTATLTVTDNCGAPATVSKVITVTQQPSQFCGNNRKEVAETCDGADLSGQTCITQGFTGGILSCDPSSNCTRFNTSACTNPLPPTCNNGIVETGEQCDDGNTNNGDGCSSSCVIELGQPGGLDGIVISVAPQKEIYFVGEEVKLSGLPEQ